MSENTKIEWADHTFNPWEGCTKVSPGCANCYAEARNHRFGMDNWGVGKPRRRTSEANWKMPLRWNRESFQFVEMCDGRSFRGTFRDVAAILEMDVEALFYPSTSVFKNVFPVRPRVFCASLADWLDDEVPIEWLADLLKLIHDTPNLDWLLLTKRPENWRERCGKALMWMSDTKHIPLPVIAWLQEWVLNGYSPSNVWIGTTIENQAMADKRIPELLKIPARVRFLSCEPLLGPVDLTRILLKKSDHPERGNRM